MYYGGEEAEEANTVKLCKETCMEAENNCAAIDFFNGKCFVHFRDLYDDTNLKPMKGAMHYYVVSCYVHKPSNQKASTFSKRISP